MLLLIDAGNTLIKWALTSAKPSGTPGRASWLCAGEMPHAKPDLLLKQWQNALQEQSIKRALVSNVAGDASWRRIASLIEKLRPMPLRVERFVSLPSLAGVTNGYADFAQLGSDRFASLVGAKCLFPDENLVVVTCGTATTVDALTAGGVFIGGMILPGLKLMAHSLFGNTAQLPDIGQMTENIPSFATDTISAICSGCMTAQAGCIEHAVTVHASHLAPVRCVMSGGAAKLVFPYLSIPAQIVDNLVLTGLQVADAASGFASDPLC